MGQGSMLYFPVSAPGDSPTGSGYLTAWTMGAGAPKQALGGAKYIQGVSNSSPLILSNGDVYLAAGGTLCGFQPSGAPVAAVVSKNIFKSNYIFQNQVVSYPLYAGGLIWISSQTGYLFAINPNTLQPAFPAVDIGSRMDGSPTLVYGAKRKFTNVRVWKTDPSGLITNLEPGYYGGYFILPQSTSSTSDPYTANVNDVSGVSGNQATYGAIVLNGSGQTVAQSSNVAVTWGSVP